MIINPYIFAASPLVLESTSTVLAKASYLGGDRSAGENFMANQCLWEDGKTILAYPRLWSGGVASFAMMVYYDDRNGFYTAPIEVGVKGGGADRHLNPVFGINTDGTFFVIEENTHVGNINVFLGDADFSEFPSQPSVTATSARYSIYKTSTGWAVIYQDNQDELAVQTCDADGTNWSAKALIYDGTASSRGYGSKPFGFDKDPDGWYRYVIYPIYTSGAQVKVKFVVKTLDFITFYNEQETHNFNAGSPLTDATFFSNGYAAIGAHTIDSEYDDLSAALSPSGKLLIMSWDKVVGTGIIRTTVRQGGAWVTNTCDTGLYLQPGNSVDTTMPCVSIYKSDAEIYFVVGVSEKPHLLKSTDLGVTWTDLGDMLPDRTGFYRVTCPTNYHEIPNNRNFQFFFSEDVFDNVTAVDADIYAVKAAFGQIQTETPVPFTDTLTALADVADFDFIYEVDDYDSTVTGFYDKSGNNRTGAKVGSPTVVDGEMIFNGTNQSIAVGSPTDFNADTKFTACFVSKLASGTTAYMLSFANSASSSAFCYIMLTSTGLRIFRRNTGGASDTIQVDAVCDTSVYNIYSIQGDGKHYRIYVNGLELTKTYAIGAGVGDLIHNGKWAGSITSMNSVRIGGLGRSGPVFSPLGFKAGAYANDAVTRTNRKKIENFLANKYSISITNNVE